MASKNVNLFYRHNLLSVILSQIGLVESAGAAEYTNCISAEGVRLPNECPGYDTKQSDAEDSVMLDLWGMWSTPSLPLLPGPL